jgi:hypothetical protein
VDAVAIATWGLVAATGLLVVASIVPVVNAFQDRRRAREVLAAQVVPTLHLLKGRLIGAQHRLMQAAESGDDYLIEDFRDDDVGGLLHMIRTIVDNAHKFGLKFTNEIFVAQHLITQAGISAAMALDSRALTPPDRLAVDNNVKRSARLCLAAANTLGHAESSLPPASTQIEGEVFDARFKRLGKEREKDAEAELIEARYQEDTN